MHTKIRWYFAGLLMLIGTASCATTETYQTRAPEPSDPNYNATAELEQWLAPIALYPDTVLTHILIASTYPLEVVQADRWVKANNSLGGQAAADGVSHMDWDPSVKALVAFPHLLDRMSQDLDWTQNLGEAFLADEAAVLAAVQNLRERAYASGNLSDMEYLQATRVERVIYIEPVEERVVYLPYYDPYIVYGPWAWAYYPPVYWRRPVHVHHHHGHFYWSSRYALSTSFYFGAISWPTHSIVILHNTVRPRYYHARAIATHSQTSRWQHRPEHRRNVAYRNHRAHTLFGDLENTPSRAERHNRHEPGYSNRNTNIRDNRYSNVTSSREDRHSNESREHRQAHERNITGTSREVAHQQRYERVRDEFAMRNPERNSQGNSNQQRSDSNNNRREQSTTSSGSNNAHRYTTGNIRTQQLQNREQNSTSTRSAPVNIRTERRPTSSSGEESTLRQQRVQISEPEREKEVYRNKPASTRSSPYQGRGSEVKRYRSESPKNVRSSKRDD